jgi:hypothetical protein
MRHYVAITGGLMLEALGKEAAPFPKLVSPGTDFKGFKIDHIHDIYDAFWSVTIEHQIPMECIPSLLKFQGPHGVRKIIGWEGSRIATAWLDRHYMMGALSGGGKMYSQLHPFIIHWKSNTRDQPPDSDGAGVFSGINTLRIMLTGKENSSVNHGEDRIDVDAVVKENRATISALRLPADHDFRTCLCFEIKNKNAKTITYRNGILDVEGFKIKIDGPCGKLSIDSSADDTAFIPLEFSTHSSGMETMLIDLEILDTGR